MSETALLEQSAALLLSELPSSSVMTADQHARCLQLEHFSTVLLISLGEVTALPSRVLRSAEHQGHECAGGGGEGPPPSRARLS